MLSSPHEKIFAPHFTIAYRDLKPAVFQVAWEEYRVKSFSAEFQVDKIYLLQFRDEIWEVIAETELSDDLS